jgi:hypothetical protein
MVLALVAPEAAQGAKKKKPTFASRECAPRSSRVPKDPREVPDWLLQISYDQWRDIRFKPESSMWRGKNSNFEVQFFHAGLYDRTGSTIDSVRSRLPLQPEPVRLRQERLREPRAVRPGYAGFRVHYPIKQAGYKDEVIVFVGASYSRVGKQHVYGSLGARWRSIGAAAGRRISVLQGILVRPAPARASRDLRADSPRPRARHHDLPGRPDAGGRREPPSSKKVGKIGTTSMFFSANKPTRRGMSRGSTT